MSRFKFMMYDRDEGKFVVLRTTSVVKAIYTAWNHEFPVYERESESCIFDGHDDNEENNEMLRDYDLRVIDHEGLRKLQTISTGEIHKATWRHEFI